PQQREHRQLDRVRRAAEQLDDRFVLGIGQAELAVSGAGAVRAAHRTAAGEPLGRPSSYPTARSAAPAIASYSRRSASAISVLQRAIRSACGGCSASEWLSIREAAEIVPHGLWRSRAFSASRSPARSW